MLTPSVPGSALASSTPAVLPKTADALGAALGVDAVGRLGIIGAEDVGGVLGGGSGGTRSDVGAVLGDGSG